MEHFITSLEKAQYRFIQIYDALSDFVKQGQVIGFVGPKNVYNVPGNPYSDSSGNPDCIR